MKIKEMIYCSFEKEDAKRTEGTSKRNKTAREKDRSGKRKAITRCIFDWMH